MKPLLILKLGSTLPELAARRGDYEDWIAAALGADGRPLRVVRVADGEALPECAAACGAVVTGSHHMVTERLEWSERAAGWLADAVRREVPVLGICYGHQLLAHALGGRVADNPAGREFGTVRVTLLAEAADDPLLGGLPNPMAAHVSHRQSAVELPPGARLLAYSMKDKHQAFRVGRCAWGVQFHPEFDRDVVLAYLRARRDALAAEGQDPDRLEAEVQDTPAAAEVLRRFGRLALGSGLQNSSILPR